MASKRDELVAIEKGFWTANSDYYKEHADSSCLIAFADMAGVMGNKDLAAMATAPQRWHDLELDIKGLLEPQDGVVILSYEARATRENGEFYNALVSSAYLRRNDGWKLVFHSQAPLPDKNA